MYNLVFDNIFSTLPSAFYTKLAAEGFAKQPKLISFNQKLADLIGLEAAAPRDPAFAEYFSGNRAIPGGDPLAMVYAGHQFGVWVPQLGDGRALLIGQIKNKNGQRFDVQLKGAGKTPYSRFADGRAVLRSTIREYLCSEIMASLNIPTTRALSIVTSGEQVRRERWEPGAILTRIATSHIRFGHVEYFCHNHDQPDKTKDPAKESQKESQKESLVKTLLDHVINYYLPQYKNSQQPYHDLLSWVVDKTAALMADWQTVGFCHGVMNTDNMSLLGDTIDYGPFGFLEEYNPAHICNHTDEGGRYSFQNQPRVAWWNLYALGVAMRPVMTEADAEAIIKPFATQFEGYFYQRMVKKLGLPDAKNNDKQFPHKKFIADWLNLLEQQKADYTLSHIMLGGDKTTLPQYDLFQSADGKKFLADYAMQCGDAHDAQRRAQMAAHNPMFVLRNWVAQVVIEEAEKENYQPLNDILRLCQSPFNQSATESIPPELKKYCAPAPLHYQGLSVSCSS
ncbi:MAG: YdiU family protein [Hydrotalea sp.]|nr:YdiU family protein [Hydrotalea sp.]